MQRLSAPPDPALAAALGAFERQFRYPLGPGRWFRIDHGDDYPRFFRAIGDAACFVARDGDEVLGTLGTARARLRAPDGSLHDVLYVGDLKVDPAARGGRALFELVRAARAWAEPWARAAFAVVMDGTAVTPGRYTGRLGIPRFEPLAQIVVLRIPARPGSRSSSTTVASPRPAFALALADPGARSLVAPRIVATRGASGRLDDTRCGKRLFADDDTELVSAHLGELAYDDVDSASELVRHACAVAAAEGFAALFVAFPPAAAHAVCDRLGDGAIVRAPATIWGTGLPHDCDWLVDTAAI
ncbi:MAG TPA: GNAT family N-acetyltransferase [Nannocystaceae bacterium]|nr:GNAT family N-acetyltransferase [Nannocystaceae bacterium]